MAFRADLEVDEMKFRVLDFTYNFHSPRDVASGQATGRLIAGTLTFEVEVTAVNALWDYMITNRLVAKGKIVFKKSDEDSPLRTISFEQAFVVDLTEHFTAIGGQPMTMRFTISCEKMVLGGNSVENLWSRNAAKS